MSLTIYNYGPSFNVGDTWCGPEHYFDFLKGVPVKRPQDYTPGDAIFGGGGLFHTGFETFMEQARDSGCKTAIWGAGMNRGGRAKIEYPEWFSKFALVGMRDYGNPWEYVPCPSCLNRGINMAMSRRPAWDAVIYEASDKPPIRDLIGAHYPAWNNARHSDMLGALTFLALGKLVVTNSFHGAYWAMIMGRKVMVFKPPSERFLAFKPQLVVADEANWRLKMDEALEIHPPADYLQECRALNRKFADKVRTLFNLL